MLCDLLFSLYFYTYLLVFFLMIRRPPRSTRTDTLFPYTTLFRSGDNMSTASKDNGFFSKERITAPPGFNRWMIPPAALAVHLCIGQAYAFSVFNNPMTRLLGITESTAGDWDLPTLGWIFSRSEEHTSELQSLMRISYAVL